MNGLDSEYDDSQLTFIRLDANSDEGADIQRSYGLRGHPSIALINANGEPVNKFVGAQSADTLRTAIDQLLAAP